MSHRKSKASKSKSSTSSSTQRTPSVVYYSGISPEQLEKNCRQFAKALKETDRRLTAVEQAVAKLKEIRKSKDNRSEEQRKIDKLVEEIGPSIFGH